MCVGSHVNEGRLDTNMCTYVYAHRHHYRFTCVPYAGMCVCLSVYVCLYLNLGVTKCAYVCMP